MKYIVPVILLTILALSCSRQREGEMAGMSQELVMPTPEDKIWAHRVNTLQGLVDRVEEFRGVELDIFYDPQQDIFEVKHDKDSAGLPLGPFLDSLMKVKDVLIWFDYKNLNDHPAEGVASLCSLLKVRGLERKAFVESYYAKELEQFYGKIATSFWVSSSTIPEDQKERDLLYREKYGFIDDLDANMLSASYEMFEFLVEYFPHRTYNFWMSGTLSEEQRTLLVHMASTPNVNVVLIDGNKNLLR